MDAILCLLKKKKIRKSKERNEKLFSSLLGNSLFVEVLGKVALTIFMESTAKKYLIELKFGKSRKTSGKPSATMSSLW